MAFDVTAFERAKFADSIEDVAVPALAPFFPEGEPPVFRVRGLTGSELGRVNEAQDKARAIQAMATALLTGSAAEKAEAFRASLGVGDDVPSDIIRRHELLVHGCVEPACPLEMAVKLAQNYPVEFFALTNAILRLTGVGRTPGKLSGSGSKATSGPA